MEQQETEEKRNLRMELIRLKVDARTISLHEWLERALELVSRIEQKAIQRDRLTRVIGPGRVVEVRGKE
jgi:hypothetical protein